nr:hypothetical protein MmNV_34 [Menippe mercenaria nudivirus]
MFFLNTLIATDQVCIKQTIVPPSITATKHSKDGQIMCVINNVTVNNKHNDIHELYTRNETLTALVPRGLSFYTLQYGVSNVSKSELLLAGMKEIANYNDINTSNSIKNSSSAVLVPHVGGILGMFSGVKISGVFYLVAGTPDEHIIFNKSGHIAEYVEIHKRNSSVLKIANAVFGYWTSLNAVTRSKMEEDFIMRKYTVICKLLQPNDFGYVEGKAKKLHYTNCTCPNLIGITITSKDFLNNDSYTATLQARALNIMETKYKLNTLNAKSVAISNLSYEVFLANNTEWIRSFLIYYVDDAGSTVAVVHHKTKWYRVIKIIQKHTNAAIQGKKKKYLNIQLVHDNIVKELESLAILQSTELSWWNRLALSWLHWFDTRPIKAKKNYTFPKLWVEFKLKIYHVTYKGLQVFQNYE